MKRIALSWSSGKDSAWALHLLRQTPDVEVVALITTFNSTHDRVAMHAVRRILVETQAERIGLPLWQVELPWPCPNGVYEELMAGICRRASDEGLSGIAFGDLFLRDIREYRERQLQGTGLEPIFPVWDVPTDALAREMIAGGVKAKLTCIDPRKLNRGFAGRDFDATLLADLPAHIDPCGENGEFHSFVYDAPVFSSRIPVLAGEIVEREGFVLRMWWRVHESGIVREAGRSPVYGDFPEPSQRAGDIGVTVAAPGTPAAVRVAEIVGREGFVFGDVVAGS